MKTILIPEVEAMIRLKRNLRIKVKYSFKVFIVLSVSIIYSFHSYGQGDPLNWTEPIKVNSNDIFLIWTEGAGYTSAQSFQKTYDFNNGVSTLALDSMISKSPRKEDNRLGGGNSTDAATGKFTLGPRDNVVTIWGGELPNATSWIYVMLPVFDTTETMWTQSIQDSIGGDIQNDRIYVRTLDIDGDSLDEFVVSYLDSQDSVHFNLYDVDENLNPILLSTFSDESVYVNSGGFSRVRYYIETGDFNNDGTDEIALLKINNQSGLKIHLNIYDVQEDNLIATAEDQIYNFSFPGMTYFGMGIVAGQFINDEKEELGIALFKQQDGQNRSYNWLIEMNENLDEITKSDDRQFTQVGSSSFCIASGDLNNDGIDELITANEEKIYVLEIPGDTLNIGSISSTDVISGGNSWLGEMNSSLKVADGNQDGINDVIFVKDMIDNNQQEDGFYLAIFSPDTAGNLDLIGQMFGDEQVYVDQDDPEYEYRPYSIAVGNFDGLNFTIGEPTYYSASDIVKPIVILNAPPIHFDMFDGETFDVNECYNGGDCDFVSTYISSITETVEVQTEIHKDWTVSAGLAYSGSVTVEPMGVGISYNVETHLLLNHGEHFSNSTTDITQLNIEFAIGASEDDYLYSTVVDYDIWEYPVYHGNETTPRSTILTSVPTNVAGQSFPSKSYTAVSFLPEHEVSNILSYNEYDLFSDNPSISQIIQANYASDSYLLSSGSDVDWDLTMTEFTSNEADTVKENGIDIRLQYGLFVFEGNYQNKKTVTHKTSVSNSININIHLGGLDLGIGDVKYTVTPYAYWDKQDALVIDYTAKPEVSPPGYPETWWQEMYGESPDPTFILPWRLDPEKGFSISEPEKRFQSKDILFSPENPQPGDTLTITARVRNFSLVDTDIPVDVSFFIGNPDSTGTPIYGLNGSNTVSTSAAIPARGKSDAVFMWIVPTDLVAFPRIYAVLDVDDEITEVHESNNMGFNVLGFASGVISNIEDVPSDESSFSTSYPNPFSSYTNIKYTLQKGNKTIIKIFDHLGREVATLMNKYQSAGNYIVPFNGSKLNSGIYYYRIQSGNFIETKKMLMIK